MRMIAIVLFTTLFAFQLLLSCSGPQKSVEEESVLNT